MALIDWITHGSTKRYSERYVDFSGNKITYDTGPMIVEPLLLATHPLRELATHTQWTVGSTGRIGPTVCTAFDFPTAIEMRLSW